MNIASQRERECSLFMFTRRMYAVILNVLDDLHSAARTLASSHECMSPEFVLQTIV